MFNLREDRMKKLARHLEELAEKDARLERQAQQIAALRVEAACELHRLCGRFVESVNQLITTTRIELGPAEYGADTFRDTGPNLLQINARGRLIQVEFHAADSDVSTENFRTAYILEGKIRCINQELLERMNIYEQSVFFCLDKKKSGWVFYDAPTGRSGPLDEEYLLSLMERLI